MNKPHIKLIGGVWRCQDHEAMATGQTPRDCYTRWLAAAIKVAFQRDGHAEPIVDLPKSKRQPATRRPQKPKALDGLDIPVFVAGPRDHNLMRRPALSLASVGLRVNGERAMKAQKPTRSLAGGGRGGK